MSKGLKNDVDTVDDSNWRNSIRLLDCNSRLYNLRTDKFKNVLNNVISETQKDAMKTKKRDKNPFENQMEEFDRVFHDGNETVVKDENQISMNYVDLGFEKDPLISHISSKFSGSGIKTSFFQNLEVRASLITFS